MAGFDNDTVFGQQGLDIGVHPATGSPTGSFEVDTSGGEVKVQIRNTSDTANSDALQEIRVGGTSAGDPWVQWTIGTARSYAFGIDNSDSDIFKLTTDNDATVDPSSGTELFTYAPAVDSANFHTTFFGNSHDAGNTPVSLSVTNENAGAAADAFIDINAASFSTGDAHMRFGTSVAQWNIGGDQGDSGTFHIKSGVSALFDQTTVQKITVAGEVTFPTTPAFLAQADGTQLNIPINASTTIEFPTEITDQNADYNNGTDTFTAPVTGNYQLSFVLQLVDVDATTTSINWNLVTSNRSYTFHFAPNIQLSADGIASVGLSILADMDAADTALVSAQVNNTGAAQMDISAGSYFSGQLTC